MKLLGISCYYHDSAACLIDDGHIVAAAQEERFTRVKHDSGFPVNAVRYCLAEGANGGGGATSSTDGERHAERRLAQLDGVVFYDKPLLKFHRILESYLAVVPRGLRSYVQALPRKFETKDLGPNVVFQDGATSDTAKNIFPTDAQMQAWDLQWQKQTKTQYKVTRTDPVTMYTDCSKYSAT